MNDELKLKLTALLGENIGILQAALLYVEQYTESPHYTEEGLYPILMKQIDDNKKMIGEIITATKPPKKEPWYFSVG